MKLLINDELLIDSPDILPIYSIGTVVYLDEEMTIEYTIAGISVNQYEEGDEIITETSYVLKDEDGNLQEVTLDNILYYIMNTNEYDMEYYTLNVEEENDIARH